MQAARAGGLSLLLGNTTLPPCSRRAHFFNVRKGTAVVRTGDGEVITMQPHLDALKTFLNVKGLGTPETTCIQISLATIFIHQNAFDSDLVKQVPIMRTILGGYTADDYRSCSESWECSLEKAKSNLDKRLAEERLLLGMVLQSFSEEIPDANLTGSAKQLISDAAAAYTEMTA